jgi:hypothetical protein
MPADWSTLPAELQLNIYGHLLNTVGNPGAREKILKTRLLCCQIKREFEHAYLKRIPQRIAKSLRKIVNRFTPYRLIKPRTFIDCLYPDIRLPVSWARALCRAMCVFHQRRRAWMTEVQKVVCHDVRSIRLHIDHTRDSVDPRAVQPYQHWYDIDPVVMGLLNLAFTWTGGVSSISAVVYYTIHKKPVPVLVSRRSRRAEAHNGSSIGGVDQRTSR